MCAFESGVVRSTSFKKHDIQLNECTRCCAFTVLGYTHLETSVYLFDFKES